MLLSVSSPKYSPTTSMVSTSLSRNVGCGPRCRNRRSGKLSSIRQYTAIMNVVISLPETFRLLCLFRSFTNTMVSFTCQVKKTCTSGNLSIQFQVGVIEHLDFPEQTFDVALSTIMMHHLSETLKRQGLGEIFRVLKPGGRLVIADFKRPEERSAQPVRFGAGGSRIQDLSALLKEAGF